MIVPGRESGIITTFCQQKKKLVLSCDSSTSYCHYCRCRSLHKSSSVLTQAAIRQTDNKTNQWISQYDEGREFKSSLAYALQSEAYRYSGNETKLIEIVKITLRFLN